MKARLDNYVKAVVEAYAPYKDVIVSWDIVNEPVDDFTGQIRNRTDSPSQRGDWGNIWHDFYPAKYSDGSLRYTTLPNNMNVIDDPSRLFDESEWMRWVAESFAKWADYYNCDWPMYVNDYMDSNKPYTKLQPTLDILGWINGDLDLKGKPLVYGLQGRLAWAYPTIPMLRKQVEDALDIVDMVGVTEGDIRSDFEPNPFYDPTKPTTSVNVDYNNSPSDNRVLPIPKWNVNDLGSGSGSYSNPSAGTLTNTFDAQNGPTRRIPEWGTGNGMGTATAPIGSARYNCTSFLAISEDIMKLQADFAADWMDILVDHAGRVELFQWDGTTDSATFNGSKGAHLWVSGITGRTGTFEKYSFFATIGSPVRNKLKMAIGAFPPSYWDANAGTLAKAQALLEKRIYTLEGVNDVKVMTASLNAALASLSQAYLTYDANGGAGSITVETYAPDAGAVVKTASAVGISKAGYALKGWTANVNGIGKVYAPGETIVMGVSVRLYAQWVKDPDSYTVKFESYNLGYSGATLINPVFVDQQVAAEGNVVRPLDPVKKGYGFYGWYRNMELTNKWDFAAPVTEDMRLYAKWGEPLDGVYFTYTGMISATEIRPGETLSIEAHSDADAPQVMMIALYAPDGKLIKYESVPGDVAGGKARFSSDFSIPSSTPSGALFKVFIWDAATYIPVQGATLFPA
jgi:uncharacterized repeat protein (TIGR02543 family)